MLQEVNNLWLLVDGEPERALEPDEKERMLKRLRSGKDSYLN